jgi:hypothetical protein
MKFLTLAILALSLNAFADHHEENFDKVKASMLERLDQKIANLQSAKGCISGAANKEAVKKCREDMKAQHKDIHEKGKAKRQEMKEEFKKQRELKKAEKKK